MEKKKKERERKERISHLEHKVVRNVRLVRLYSLQYEGVPQVKERAQVNQDWMRKLSDIYSSFRDTKQNIVHKNIIETR